MPRALTGIDHTLIGVRDLEKARRSVFPAFGVLERTEQGVLLRGQTEDLPWFARELARLPFAFEVRSPSELREALAEHARRLLDLAGRGAPRQALSGARPSATGRASPPRSA